MAARPPLLEKYVILKQATDLHTCMLSQMLVERYLERGDLEGDLQRIRDLYRERRDAMLAALRHSMPEGVRFTHPAGGLFVWVELPGAIDDLFCNRARFEAGGLTPIFSDHGLGCPLCAICKGRVCETERAAGARRVIFVGDGSSDRCVIGAADGIAAVAGGILADECEARGVGYLAFRDLAEVAALL